ncbi:Alpha-L-rhamnosidase N-terminal domain-containing protein [Chryseolinea serpens]|uniref:Alpha-L-rhamnosidase N-terminal domain-containing protein n=1 Tax=Chryseolinea serpens TaxID=947013 RepID=A0A1M5TCJ6_9BACT|nr:alpha-L-rhamnosidase C-terminal domain-containing protein [Chryseolinea serpens]SHH48439.1 Alpha-L-rhamnosidase N-terminal domain-containing protein [Chryseolinea serpens]
MARILFAFLISTTLFHQVAWAQQINPDLFKKPWNAQWITGPGVPINRFTASSDLTLKEYAVVKFRKTIELQEKPASFIIHVSGDNRYKLYVNGKQVSQGPARGDLYFWNFETVDIASSLNTGSNVVSAVVWNDGRLKPEAQISYLTAFIIQGNTEKEEVLNTNDSWKTIKDESYQPKSVRVPGYYVAGPGELVTMSKHVKGWGASGFDDGNWSKARIIAQGLVKNVSMNSTGWMLVPSPLPQMEMTVQRLTSTRKASGVQVPNGFPATKTKVTIPANTRATILLDQGYLTNAYPTVAFSGGRNAGMSIAYAEGLYIRKNENLSGFRVPSLPKGNRNDVEGKVFIGKADSVLSDGTANQEYTPLWWRTYRYVQLVIATKDEPLSIDDVYGTFTGYPFVNNAKLVTKNDEMQKMLDIGWRTARLCAFETYMDCPYYEQLQYIGDARIQAMVSIYNAGDDRLVRHGLTLMDHSRLAEGITLSRYPTDLKQEIPTFSLWWIAMLHDYYMYRPDSLFIKDKLPGARQVLSFFERYQQSDGSLKQVPYWVYTDWSQGKGWNFGMAPIGSNGESAVLDLTLLYTYQLASELEGNLGLDDFSRLYSRRADLLKKTIQQKYWDETRGLYADTQTKDAFSQHANSLAILTGISSGEKATALANKMLNDTTLAPASIYFKYYLHQALVKAGLGNDYLKWLDKWRENISLGMSTWAETSDVNTSRSDCHAWGSSPNIEFFRTILGIESGAPGFSKIMITPHLGTIEDISGEMPHPNGKISVKYKLQKGVWQAEINLPPNSEGTFVWKEKSYPLKGGENTFKL